METADKVEKLTGKIENKVEDVKDKYLDYKHNLLGYIGKNPLTAVAIAAAAGVLIGITWGPMHCKCKK